MTAIVICFAVGTLFVAFEVLVPGGILGTLGAVALFCGVAISFYNYGLNAGAAAFFGMLALVCAVLFAELKWLPETALGRRLSLRGSVTGAATAAPQHALVGARGQALTVLAPTGYVLINGQQHEAFSRSGFIAAGSPVTVVAAESFRLIVTPAAPAAKT